MAAPYDFKRDGNGVAYTTILEPADGSAIETTSATTVALPAQSGFVMVTTTAPVNFLFADNGTTTAGPTDPVLLPGTYYFRAPAGSTHLAVTALGDDGVVSVLRMV